MGGPLARSLFSLLAAALALGARPASAFEFFDGRVQVHGFYEAQVRSLVRDYDFSDHWDLTQWWNVLNVEIESDIAPDGFGPFDLISGFTRIELRYDCVWTHACGMFPSVNAYGKNAEQGRLPRRLIDDRLPGFNFQLPDGDTRHRYDIGFPRNKPNKRPPSRDCLSESDVAVFPNDVNNPNCPRGRALKPLHLLQLNGFDGLFGIDAPVPGSMPPTPNGMIDPLDPAPFMFSQLEDCLFGSRKTDGQIDGNGNQTLPHSVDKNRCRKNPLAFLKHKPNPFRGAVDFYGNPNVNPRPNPDGTMFGDYTPVTDTVGGADLPLRPATRLSNLEGTLKPHTAAGMWYPNAVVARRYRHGDFDEFDQNFTQKALSWNHGASQEDTGELKEAYLDLEAFDSRLWLRVGKQQIVWGKTELFRTTDQFNPQDLALASLPSLEESRIALFALRGVWSFYDVGPLEDVRLELAANIQDFEPADLGVCGEPYTPLPVCNKSYGLIVHGVAGIALAGEKRPPSPWDEVQGFEIGGRLEFRWDRFSFSLMDFYGYEDTPHSEQLFVYSRNVDPLSGRPVHTMVREGNCPTGAEADCLIGIDTTTGRPFAGTPPDFGGTGAGAARVGWPDPDPTGPVVQKNALEYHSVNMQTFGLICSTSIGFSTLDLTACGQSVFNSPNNALSGTPVPPDQRLGAAVGNLYIPSLLANGLVGNPLANGILSGGLAGAPIPFVTLNVDPCDGFLADCTTPGLQTSTAFVAAGPTMNTALTSYQQALLGCGEFYGTNCELDGIDLANTEASVFLQSLVGFEGTPLTPSLLKMAVLGDTDAQGNVIPNSFNGTNFRGNTFDFPQPGTVGFVPHSGPVATRVVDGRVVMLPGSRGPGDAGYDVNVDGSNTGLVHPFFDATSPFFQGTDPTFDATFRSEMAAASFNSVMALVALSTPADPASPTRTEFDNRSYVNGIDDNEDGVVDNTEDQEAIGPYRHNGCSFVVPHLCGSVAAFASVSGLQSRRLKAGGNKRFGRRDFSWHGGQDLILRYEKRNVLGLSADFAEDVTKTNWGMEFTWIEGLNFTNNEREDGSSESDTLNLTLSVDRPTFINFLNQNRTFFFNSQWFFQYLPSYNKGFTSNGPFNVLGTFTAQTGYFQDRLLPSVTFVWDMRSDSGAALPQVTYRFTENFSASFGLASFWGRFQQKSDALVPVSLQNRVGRDAYKSATENLLAVVRERDEVYLRVRYTF